MSSKPVSYSNPDLDNCDQEPIHIIGQIQSIGYVLVLDKKSLEIVQASENVSELLEAPVKKIIGTSIEYYFPFSFLEYINNLAKTDTVEIHSLNFELRQTSYLLTSHQSDGYWVLDIEKDDSRQRDHSFLHYSDLVENTVGGINELDSVEEIAEKFIIKVREITGFNRLMVYRFDEENHGEVIAENKDPELDSYMGLKFPNTDIPPQARKLYLKNRVRGIYDVDDVPSSIYPPIRKQDGKPLDLSHSFLRNVSPIHIQYLKNMGVRASFSISVVIKDKLWGMILCHHTDTPVHLNLYQRRACLFIGRMLSHRIESKLFDEQFKGFRDSLKTTQTVVHTLMATNDMHHAMDMNTARILAAFKADYFALQFEGKLTTSHPSLRAAWVKELLGQLSDKKGGSIHHTINILKDYEPSEHESLDPAGMLSIQLSRKMDEYLIFFRKSQVQKVSWAGKPKGKGPDDITSLAPRHSFDKWTEIIQDQSLRWEPGEIQFAKELRMQLIQNIITVFQGKEHNSESATHIKLNSRLLERISELEEKNRQLADNLKGMRKSEAHERMAKEIAEEKNRIKPV